MWLSVKFILLRKILRSHNNVSVIAFQISDTVGANHKLFSECFVCASPVYRHRMLKIEYAINMR